MKSLVDALKKMNDKQAQRNMNVEIMYGTVINLTPLEIKVDNRFILDEDFLVLTTNVKYKELDLSHTHSYSGGTTGAGLNSPIVINEGLTLNDNVMLLRADKGQKFIVLDKL